MNLFQPGLFQPVLFQTGQASSVARSGWFRQLLSEIQEKAMQDDEQKKKLLAEQKSCVAQKTVVAAPQQKKNIATVGKNKQKFATKEKPEAEKVETSVRLKPLFRQRIVEVPEVGPVARSVVDELHGWAKDFYALAKQQEAMLDRLRKRLEIDVAEIKRKRRKRRISFAILLGALR